MKFCVVTTYADKHWNTYAKRCVESFRAHWQGVELLTYTDAQLEKESTWLADFKKRNGNRKSENYRYDAVRFSHKIAAIELAHLKSEADVLVWMDADCYTHANVTPEWLSSLLEEADFAYLKRNKKYPECGFFMMRRKQESVQLFLAKLVRLYKNDSLFMLHEWHDSYAIEHCRARTEGLSCVSLSGGAEDTGHPLINGPLGAKLDHLKGARKTVGRSRASDLKVKRSENYWQ